MAIYWRLGQNSKSTGTHTKYGICLCVNNENWEIFMLAHLIVHAVLLSGFWNVFSALNLI